MRTKQALAVLLTLLLAALPLWSSPDVLGTITNSQETSIRGANAVPGGSIFNGDTVTVGGHGVAWVSFVGGAQAQLGRDSQVQLSRAENAIELEVSSGEVIFRATPNAAVVGSVADATFQPVNDGLAVAQIRFLQNDIALFLVQQGDWALITEHDGASVTLHPGENMEARIVPASSVAPAPPQANPPAAEKKKKKKKLAAILIGAGAVGAAVGIGLAVGSNESTVTFQQKLNAISPVVP